LIPQKNNVCFLFTKKYPFGKQEAYIHYEIEYLAKAFNEVYIIPVEEFEFGTKREIKSQNVFIFPINQNVERVGLISKLIDTIKNNWLLLNCTIVSREKLNSIKSHFLYARRLIHIRAQGIALKKFIKNVNSQQDIICYHYWMHNSIVVEYLSGIKPKKTVTRAHALDLYHKDWPSSNKNGFLQFEKLKVNYCDRIFSISQHGINHLNKYFKNSLGKVFLSRLGIFDQNPVFQPKELSSELIMVTCSSLVERKRLFLMPQILKHLKHKVKWIHIGGNASPESNHLIAECRQNNIQFEFKGQMTSAEIIDFYKITNIALFCNLSYAEGIPVSLMEAAMFGIPMLATDTFGNPEIVNHQNGILIPVDFKPEEAAAAIDALFENNELWKEKSLQSREVYKLFYNADLNFSEFIQQIK
jgi:glycosyltransferase involved in cell wall biosynthesis